MKHIYGGIGLFALFVFALPFMENAGAAGLCDQPYSGSGNWFISGAQYCENVEYTITGNVTIQGRSQVTWKNVVLRMDVGSGALYIKSENDANVTMDGVKITATKADSRYYVQLNNPRLARISNSEFGQIGWRDWIEQDPGKGFEISANGSYGQVFEVTGNYFYDGANGLYLTSYPTAMTGFYAANNRVTNMVFDGFYLNQVQNSTFEGNYFNGIQEHRGIMCAGCGGNLFNQNVFYNAPNGGGMLITGPPNNTIPANKITNSYFGEGLLHGVGVSAVAGTIIENNVFENNIVDDERAGVIDFLPYSSGSVVRYNTIRNSRIGVEYFSPPNTHVVEFNNLENNLWNAKINGGDTDKNLQNNYWGSVNCAEIDAKIWDNEESFGGGKALFEPLLNEPYPGGQSIGCNGSPREDDPIYPWSNQTLLYTDALHDTNESAYDIYEYHVAENATTLFFRATFDSIANGANGIAACGGSKGVNYRASFLINTVKTQCVYFDVPEQFITVDGTGEAVFNSVNYIDANYLFGQKPYAANYSIRMPVAINCVEQSIEVSVEKKYVPNYKKQGFKTKVYTTRIAGQGNTEEIKDIAPDSAWVKYPKGRLLVT